MNSFSAIRERRHAQWLAQLRRQLQGLMDGAEASVVRPDQVWLFGSRARGDWDGLSDLDLLVVAADQPLAELWANHLVDSGIGADVLAMDRARWRHLPDTSSPIWRAVARDALPLLEPRR